MKIARTRTKPPKAGLSIHVEIHDARLARERADGAYPDRDAVKRRRHK